MTHTYWLVNSEQASTIADTLKKKLNTKMGSFDLNEVFVNPEIAHMFMYYIILKCVIVCSLSIGKDRYEAQTSYRNRFVTQYIAYLNIWKVLSRTVSSLSIHDRVGHGFTMRKQSLKVLSIYSSKQCIVLQNDSYNL